MRILSAFVLLTLVPAQASNAQNETILRIRTSDVIHFVVTDPKGRVTGCDPRGNQAEEIVNGIPNSNYSFDTVGDLAPVTDSTVTEDVSLLFEFGPIADRDSGIYHLTAIGRIPGVYTISTLFELRKPRGYYSTDSTVKGVIDANQSVSYTFRLGDVTRSAFPAKSVNVNALQQDLMNCFKLRLLGESELHRDLTRRLDKLDKYLSDKDSSKARHELEKFQEKIDQVRKETVKTEQKKAKPPKHFISKDAYDILTEDVTLLLKQLPIDKKGKGGKQSNRLQQKS